VSRARGRARSTLAVVPALAALAVCLPSTAQANRIAVLSCHGPGGEALGHDGWINERTADGGMVALDSCGAGGAGSLSLELGGNSGGYGDEARTEWMFNAPSWGSIVSYRVALADSYTSPYGGGGVGQAFVVASDESDPSYDYRNLGYGGLGPSVIERTAPAADDFVRLNASCDGQNGRCPAGAIVSRLDVSATRIVLSDPSTPTVTGLTGTLLAPGALRGSVALDVSAGDEGPGVYSAQLSVDGAPAAPVIFDTNGGWCQSLGASGEAPRSFAHPDPCPKHASTTVSLDTSALADGRHSISLRVDDASGNATTPLESTIETDNAPQGAAVPQVTPGAPAVGATLSATPGAWSAPAGAGAISYGYAWLSCDASGAGCVPLAGASEPSLTVGEAQAGRTLRVKVTASDRDGLSSAESEPTALVSGARGAANGVGATDGARLLLAGPGSFTRAYATSAVELSGRLLSPAGAPIAGAVIDVLSYVPGGRSGVLGQVVTGADGAFAAHVARGSSRTIALGYRSFSLEPSYTAIAHVSELVRAGVLLRAEPPRSSSYGRVTFSGRVLGMPANTRVIVELLVRYRGQWQPIRTPRCGRDGRFRIPYVFQGARGSFPFRVSVPGGQAAFPYAAGTSGVVLVRAG